MKISKLLCVLIVATACMAAPVKKAEASSITVNCWNGNPFGFGPSPTVGCSLIWFPGGIGLVATMVGSYPLCSPNCIVVPGGFTVFPVNIGFPFSGTRTRQVGGNCTAGPVTVTAIAQGEAWIVARGDPIVTQEVGDTAVGPVAVFCPVGPIGGVVN